jgi:hypothetical protein
MRMAITLIGGPGDVPFNRTFFNVTLGEMVDPNGKEKPVKLTLFLSDGTTLDVCMIEHLSDQYLSVRAYRGHSDSCELAVQLIPYGLIYRIEIAPKDEESSRVGFQWKNAVPVRKGGTQRRPR